jgi:putative peptidoglycan lipid II flippase
MKLSHIAKSTLIIAVFFALDKALGLLRARYFNIQFSPLERDIFFVSNNIPDLLSALISGGALGMALIPVLTETLDQDGKQAAWRLFNYTINLAFLATGAIALIIIAFARPLVQYVIAPGFNDPAQWALTARLMRLDLAAILIFSLSGLAMAGLQTNQHFLLPAMAPGFYNLGQIVGILVLGPRFGIDGMVYGVILGALMHLGIQIPGLLHFGYRWAPAVSLREPRLRQVLWVMGPRVVNVVFLQSYFLFRDRLASFFEAGAVSAVNNGWFIQQVPETLIGTAIAIALLPTLSDHIARGNAGAFRDSVNQALRVLLALTLPVAAVLAVTIRPLAQGIFHFQGRELEMVTWTTRLFLLGLTGHTWLEVAVRSFYARQVAWVPMVAAGLQAGAFMLLAWLLSTTNLGPAGIALADTVTFTLQAVILLWVLQRRFQGVLAVGRSLLRAGLATILAGGLAYALYAWLPVGVFWAGLAGCAGGWLLSLPLVWPEVRLLIRLGEKPATAVE